MQVLSMTQHELKLMSEHMGHDVEVNMDIYRLQTSTLEKTKVARLLMAVDNGVAHKYRGQELSEIDVDGKRSRLRSQHCMESLDI